MTELPRVPFAPILICVCAVAGPSLAADLIVQGTTVHPITSNTQVDGDVIVRDSGLLTVTGAVLTVNGNVWIEGSGRLQLQSSSTLTLELDFDEEHHVDISGNGRLEISDSQVDSTGGQFWFELADDQGNIPELTVSGATSWLTNHSGIRPFDSARVTVTGGNVEELQARDNVAVTVTGAATYPVYFFDATTASLSGLYTEDVLFNINNTVSDGNWSFQITNSLVEGYQIDLKNGADVTLDDSDGIVLSIHTPGTLGDDLQIVEGLTSAVRTSGSTSNLGSTFTFTDSNVALFNLYVFGSDRVWLRDLHVNEVNAEQESELLIGGRGFATDLNCNLCQVYDNARFSVWSDPSGGQPKTTVNNLENLPSATSSYADFEPVGRGFMRFANMDLSDLDLTAREHGTLELVNCSGAVVNQVDPTAVVTEVAYGTDFTATRLSGDPPLDVDFLDLTGGTTVSGHSWTFGDSGSSAAADPSHQYTANGAYTVTLSTSGSGSDSEQKVAYIGVGLAIFSDGFESGSTAAWSSAVP